MATTTEHGHQEPWYLRSSAPVLFPAHDGFDLSMPQPTFDALVQDIVRSGATTQQESKDNTKNASDDISLVSATTQITQEIPSALAQLDLTTTTETGAEETKTVKPGEPAGNQHPFIQGLLSHNRPMSATEGALGNKMLTENADVAYRSTTSPIVDLFAELEDVVSGRRLLELLNAAWAEDSLTTLKIIFNARSIHLGKASRVTFYRCAGWLAQHHPLTLIANLRWLSRPLIQKKAEKKDEKDVDMVIVDMKSEKDGDDVTRFDVRHGVSHGYWKDLLNILVLSVRRHLDVLAHPKDVLNVTMEKNPVPDTTSPEEIKARRHSKREERNNEAIALFNSDSVYRGLQLTIARLFAEQLKTDLSLLRGEDQQAKKDISLCGKWAPSHDRFHDKHTFIVSNIAEMLHPMEEVAAIRGPMDRELFLRHSRDLYRRDISALRAHLDIVERKLSAKNYDKILYDRVPSVAMNNYSKIFAEKDTERFEEYLNGVAEGKMRISGATLMPSTLIRQARDSLGSGARLTVKAKMQELAGKVVDGQWKTLVQRIKDSGTLESSIAVCDVSGSMESPNFRDGTCPMDTAIGLSLLVAEVTAPPFGGHFITFSAEPTVESVDLSKSLRDKVASMAESNWGMNTNIVAVFEDLILPMAIRNKLSQEDMVKRVFVFSDMQFDGAESSPRYRKSGETFSSAFERIKSKYRDAGYEMPELVFWNLAGGRAGYGQGTSGDPTAPKPVTSEETGTTIVSGYSQAMLKVFLDNGTFDDPENEDGEEKVKTTEEDDAVIVDSEAPAKKRKIDPMSTVKKAISHESYDPLVVVD
ncbi:hypothetical protein FHL15_001863 [Xylaria flabelliformis]|uniref:DUF2828 domain-containing protein n=1 Tax=Xylaria flabelliformis TaxID=2512241 RepID=A0A553IA48_9PEZI|nr:hypothetical protein FHL15_001863 [Xylaria flabelliformis]